MSYFTYSRPQFRAGVYPFVARILMLLILSAVLAADSHAQIAVGAQGVPSQAFNSPPPATEWSTLSLGTSSTAVQTSSALNSQVQALSAASISVPLVSSTANPPAAGSNAAWSSAGYLQTRPAANAITLLMGTFRNISGESISTFQLEYDVMVAFTENAEELPGHHVYFSTTGTVGSWQRAVGDTTNNAAAQRSVILNVGSWVDNALLYVLWVDDNGVPPPDDIYQIDNLSGTIVQQPIITSQPQSQSVSPAATGTLTVTAAGAVPLRYQWFKDGSAMSAATNSTLVIPNFQATNAGTYRVAVSNAFGGVVSSNAVLTLNCATPVQITRHPTNVTYTAGQTLLLSTATSGSTPITYQWHRNGIRITGATNASYSKANAQAADSGFYYVAVTNCGAGVVSSNVLVGIAPVGHTIFGVTNHTWRYNPSGTDLGTAWRFREYDDSTWLSGRGIFAREDNTAIVPLIHTPLSLTNAQGQFVNTYYFRTDFVLTNDVDSVILVSSNIFDDGMVAYLNGVEVFRTNLPSGPISYPTVALVANTENTYIVTNLPASALVKGTNLLAVEVHQVNDTSSDVVFGMSVSVRHPFPSLLSIVREPVNLSVESGKTAVIDVGVEGAPVYYQWYRDGAPIPGATSNPLRIPGVSDTHAGAYSVVVSNIINMVTSAVAVVAVTPDTNSPTLVEADGTLSATTVLVSFSEPVLPVLATNTVNYRITNTWNAANLGIIRAVLLNATNVSLTTAARHPGTNYILTVNNVRDISSSQNVIAPNSRIPISTTILGAVPLDTAYVYYQPQYELFDPDPDQGTGWKEYDFAVPPYWAAGFGGFFFTTSGDSAPFTVGANLGQSELITSYFRTVFNPFVSPGGARLSLRYFVDDGAIFYINGIEIHRANMPPGPIDYKRRSVSPVTAGILTGQVEIPDGLLRHGNNVVAVELHQTAPLDRDAALALQVDVTAQSLLVGPVVITSGPHDQKVVEGELASFTVVQAAGATFQWRRNGIDMTGETNVVLRIPAVPFSYHSNRFSVVVSNSNGAVISSNAVLRIEADTSAPRLASAWLRDQDQSIVISFTEPMDAMSAATAANYLVTNTLGQVRSVTGAVLQNGTNVVLSFGSLPSQRYTVVVNNVRDASSRSNIIAPNSMIVPGYNATIVSFGGTWKYEDSGANLGTAWRNASYSDSGWPSGLALLGAKRGAVPAGMPEPLRTSISLSNAASTAQIPAAYFRRTFNAVRAAAADLTFRTVVDDGAVIYLNGLEVHRIGMPAGSISHTTTASRTVEDVPELEGPFTVQVTNLMDGQNVIAVEVHQAALNSSDLYWAGEFSVAASPEIIGPTIVPTNCPAIVWSAPALMYQRLTTNSVSFTWENPVTNVPPCSLRAVFALERAMDLLNPSETTVWVPLGTNTTQIIVTTNSTHFFRLRRL